MICEPLVRYGATGCSAGAEFHLIGGYLEGYQSDNHEPVRRVRVLETFNEKTLAWSCRGTSGIPPPGVVYAASVVYKEKLYYFGGYDCEIRYNSLFCLDLSTFMWGEITAVNPEDAPMPKCSCGMVVDDEGNLWVFGGYGKRVVREGDAVFHRNDAYERGWTNELHCFNLGTRRWSCMKSSGHVPPPMSGFTFTRIGGNAAILFGGYGPRSGTSKAVYMVNLENGHWSRVQKPVDSPDDPWPSARMNHCAVSLPSLKEDSAQLLVMGGQDKDENPLSDVWIYNTDTSTWKEVVLPTSVTPRCEHVMGTFCPSSKKQETLLLLFSGVSCKREGGQGKGSNQDAPKIAETTLLLLEPAQSPQPAQWEVKDILFSHQISHTLARAREENRELHVKIQRLQRELATKVNSSMRDLSIAVNETNNVVEVPQSSEELDKVREELEECKQEKDCEEKRAQTAEKRVQSIESELTVAEERVQSVESELTEVNEKCESLRSEAAKKSEEDDQQIQKLREQVAALQEHLASQTQVISDLNTEKKDLQREREVLKLSNRDLSEKNKTLSNRNVALEKQIAAVQHAVNSNNPSNSLFNNGDS